MVLIIVVLPLPLGPNKPTISFSFIKKETDLTASSIPYRTIKLLTDTILLISLHPL